MVLSIAALVTVTALVFTLVVRPKDIPAAESISPTQYLEERKAQIYDNLRDLQFEYRLGKLSDEDYQKTKVDLQAELAKVLADIDGIKAQQPVQKAALKSVPAPAPDGKTCPHCNAKFDRALKFCGECGKAMS